MNVFTNDTRAQQAAIELVRVVLERDERVRAAWLQGSFARGSADAWSDVDCHAAIADDAYEEFVAEMRDVIGRAAPIVGDIAVPLGSSRLLATTIELPEGLVRLDFCVERVGQAATPRQLQPVVLFDRDGVAARFVVQPLATREALERRLQALVSTFFFGAMWPVRLAGRETRGSLLLNAISVVYQLIVPAILIRTRPEEAFREALHVEHWLDPDDRERVDALVAEIHAAFDGIGRRPMDEQRLLAAHGHLTGVALLELRNACDAIGMNWPEHSESAYRVYYRRELGIELAP